MKCNYSLNFAMLTYKIESDFEIYFSTKVNTLSEAVSKKFKYDVLISIHSGSYPLSVNPTLIFKEEERELIFSDNSFVIVSKIRIMGRIIKCYSQLSDNNKRIDFYCQSSSVFTELPIEKIIGDRHLLFLHNRYITACNCFLFKGKAFFLIPNGNPLYAECNEDILKLLPNSTIINAGKGTIIYHDNEQPYINSFYSEKKYPIVAFLSICKSESDCFSKYSPLEAASYANKLCEVCDDDIAYSLKKLILINNITFKCACGKYFCSFSKRSISFLQNLLQSY